jgi:hypothetical protein
LRPITVIRAILWLSIVVTGWSMSWSWGDDPSVVNGPLNQWERHVVGAALLLLVAALAVTFTARKVEKPGGLALAIAGLASLGALALALDLRSTALDNNQGHALLGGGWLWMCAGACTAFGAVVSAFTLRFRPAPVRPKVEADPAPASQPARPKSGPSKAKKKSKRKRR